MTTNRSWLLRFLSALARSKPQAPTPAATDRSMPGLTTRAIRIAPGLTPAAVVAGTLTPELLHRLGGHDPDLWAPCLARACGINDIRTPRRLAAFLANTLVESGNLGSLVENLNYTPKALLLQWPRHFTPESAQRLGRTASHPADQRNIAEAAYGGRMGNAPSGSGDGWLYRGRGLIQLTGKVSYQRFAKSAGMALADLPRHLETHEGAADSAAKHWTESGCNVPADAGDIAGCRRIVNGGEIGLPAVRDRYAAACAALGVR